MKNAISAFRALAFVGAPIVVRLIAVIALFTILDNRITALGLLARIRADVVIDIVAVIALFALIHFRISTQILGRSRTE